MATVKPSSTGLTVVPLSLVFAMILRILPLPHEWFNFNPDWTALFLIYWTMAIPDRVGVGTAWFTGLFVDTLTGRMLGQHALAYSIIAYVSLRLYRRLRLYPLPQQSLWILIFLLISQFLVLWTQNVKNMNVLNWVYWLPSFTGALAWPAVLITLRRIRRHFSIF
ncbi:rod shape-determining protein MreD [Methylocaldum sp.]|uniref:rod shape-determining protein MreD n=1 Tax=Methylocaldum sp. TaxID=1969727 RepID=UPI002D37D2D8|nr:rod shape-determining protein MreD [Methylocaldum sp.]HYE34856.1 rod shape-determining protein MreD [Methylocaldum sp.]